MQKSCFYFFCLKKQNKKKKQGKCIILFSLSVFFCSSFMLSVVIWLHQLNIYHHVGFAPVFSKYHANTKMLLSDALIFQPYQLGSHCWI